MADGNGEIPSTGDLRVDAALERIRGKFKELEDAIVVQAFLEKQAAERIKEHATWLVDHDRRLEEEEKRREEYEKRMQRIETNLAEATDKLNLMIGREMRREGGPKAQ